MKFLLILVFAAVCGYCHAEAVLGIAPGTAPHCTISPDLFGETFILPTEVKWYRSAQVSLQAEPKLGFVISRSEDDSISPRSICLGKLGWDCGGHSHSPASDATEYATADAVQSIQTALSAEAQLEDARYYNTQQQFASVNSAFNSINNQMSAVVNNIAAAESNIRSLAVSISAINNKTVALAGSVAQNYNQEVQNLKNAISGLQKSIASTTVLRKLVTKLVKSKEPLKPVGDFSYPYMTKKYFAATLTSPAFCGFPTPGSAATLINGQYTTAPFELWLKRDLPASNLFPECAEGGLVCASSVAGAVTAGYSNIAFLNYTNYILSRFNITGPNALPISTLAQQTHAGAFALSMMVPPCMNGLVQFDGSGTNPGITGQAAALYLTRIADPARNLGPFGDMLVQFGSPNYGINAYQDLGMYVDVAFYNPNTTESLDSWDCSPLVDSGYFQEWQRYAWISSSGRHMGFGNPGMLPARPIKSSMPGLAYTTKLLTQTMQSNLEFSVSGGVATVVTHPTPSCPNVVLSSCCTRSGSLIITLEKPDIIDGVSCSTQCVLPIGSAALVSSCNLTLTAKPCPAGFTIKKARVTFHPSISKVNVTSFMASFSVTAFMPANDSISWDPVSFNLTESSDTQALLALRNADLAASNAEIAKMWQAIGGAGNKPWYQSIVNLVLVVLTWLAIACILAVISYFAIKLRHTYMSEPVRESRVAKVAQKKEQAILDRQSELEDELEELRQQRSPTPVGIPLELLPAPVPRPAPTYTQGQSKWAPRVVTDAGV